MDLIKVKDVKIGPTSLDLMAATEINSQVMRVQHSIKVATFDITLTLKWSCIFFTSYVHFNKIQ